jgi:hypothetical protein
MNDRCSLAATVTRRGLAVGLVAFIAGCGQSSVPTSAVATLPRTPVAFTESHASSDAAVFTKADVRILFIGNSHTMHHNLPDLVCRMIRQVMPGKTIVHHVVGVSHLADASINPQVKAEIEFRPWTHVVLQAQKISMSGKFLYPTDEGIDLAKRAKANGAAVAFFAEWARKGIMDERDRTETIYTEMAKESGATVIPVGRAWDAAFAMRPDLPLHEADGNHQSAMGAFLTACVVAGRLSGSTPMPFASIEFAELSAKDRTFLAEVAGQIK